MSGAALLAKKQVLPVTLQYTDAWVPYGPIEVAQAGFALLALWPRPNDETYEMSKDADTIRENLRGKPHRIILKRIDVAGEAPTTASETTLLKEAEV